MAGKQWVVRVVTSIVAPFAGPFDKEIDKAGALMELLRYAGLIRVHRRDETGMCFDVMPPKGVDATGSKHWSEANAERFVSFNANAVSAPEFPEPTPQESATDIAKRLQVPEVHLNGTSKRALIEQYEAVVSSLYLALNAMAEASPNARDYYVRGPDAYPKAAAQHEEWQRQLQKIRREVEELVHQIADK